MLTIPRSLVKSSTKDLSFPTVVIVIQTYALPPLVRGGVCRNLMMFGPETYSYSLLTGKGEYRRFSSMDSDLEAFSHNPTHGSFAPLAFQPSAMTNCVNQRFLSY